MTRTQLRQRLEALYRARNLPELIDPDPLGFVVRWRDPGDVEVAAVVAATLAYGRVAQIHATLTRVFDLIGTPAQYVQSHGPAEIAARFRGFRHRFNDGDDVAALLVAIARARRRHGSLLSCFRSHDAAGAPSLVPALGGFVEELASLADRCPPFLLARPERGSACKRWHLLLRWMVRRDAVDPGPWHELGPQRLLVPLDTHMYRIGTALGFTTRRSADQRTALEITEGFREISPEDPARYDFCLARSAMRGELAQFGIPGSRTRGAPSQARGESRARAGSVGPGKSHRRNKSRGAQLDP